MDPASQQPHPDVLHEALYLDDVGDVLSPDYHSADSHIALTIPTDYHADGPVSLDVTELSIAETPVSGSASSSKRASSVDSAQPYSLDEISATWGSKVHCNDLGFDADHEYDALIQSMELVSPGDVENWNQNLLSSFMDPETEHLTMNDILPIRPPISAILDEMCATDGLHNLPNTEVTGCSPVPKDVATTASRCTDAASETGPFLKRGRGGQYPCVQCGVEFRQTGNLRKHIAEIHEQRKPFGCTMCGVSFSRKHARDTHERAVHQQIRPFQCHICKKMYKNRSDLNKHMRTVERKEKPYSCEICGRSFGERGKLKRHMTIHDRANGR